MRHLTRPLFGIALSAAFAGHAVGQEAEVIHQWTSSGEAAAVKVIADRFNAAGGTWIDTAITGTSAMIAAELARLTGGNPPDAMQFAPGDQMRELADQGLLRHIDDVAAENNFSEIFPADFVDAITYDGHVWAIPVNNHGQNWTWYSKKVLADAGAAEPATWDEFWAAADKIKAAGLVPVAIGAQSWQLRHTFSGILATKGGRDLYRAVYIDRDEEAIRSPQFAEVVETFLKLRDYGDEGMANRDWNVAANMVVTDQAGFFFMGDWAKGEFSAAGQTAGEEFGCVILGDGSSLIMSTDSFVFPSHSDDSHLAGQALLATVMVDPVTQAEFNAKKGSLPARLDVDPNTVDACTAYGLGIIADADRQLVSLEFLATRDFGGAHADLIGRLWADPAMSVDQFVEDYITIAKTIP
jgi:glucose/mannose transport system substrate-binding protein